MSRPCACYKPMSAFHHNRTFTAAPVERPQSPNSGHFYRFADLVYSGMIQAIISLRQRRWTKYNAPGLYRDAADPRLIIPKRIPAMGWTINLGHRYGPATLALFLVVVAVVVVVAALNHQSGRGG